MLALLSALHRALRGQSGVSILEVIVAAIVVGIAAVGVALMFGAGQAFINAEGDNRIALLLAQQKVEQFRGCGFSVLQQKVTDPTANEPPTCVRPPCAEDLGPPPSTPLLPSVGYPCALASESTPTIPLPRYPYQRTWSVVGVDRDNYTTRVACPGPLPVCPGAIRIRVLVETKPLDPKSTPIELEAIVANR